MQSKSTTSLQTTQHLIAGLLQNDSNMEFYGLSETMEVERIQNGNTDKFENFDKPTFVILSNAYRSNHPARRVISKLKENGKPISYARQVEIYTYFMYGGLDSSPDVIDGKLQDPENYRHKENCLSLKFKKIRLNGSTLKEREIKMIDLMTKEEDLTNDVIAMEMGIATSTYNQHAAELRRKAGVKSKHALVMAALKNGIPRLSAASV